MTTRERTAAAIEARRQNTEVMLQRVQDAVSALRRQKRPITYAAVARRAEVSRTFLYENTDARSLVAGAAKNAAGQRAQTQAAHDAEQDLAWRERAFNAEDALNAAHAEIRSQRSRIGDLMGEIRDLEQEWSPRPSVTSPPRTPRSNSASVSSATRTELSMNGSKPRGPTPASKTGRSPSSRRRSWKKRSPAETQTRRRTTGSAPTWIANALEAR
ncbi:DUF6262 family protein [Amycolatopsis coloradensis]|uniref:DUF6262 family protein n=1 Tax=Amycolatopsis coloradensis TaxID=76021 RepID=UPI001ABF19BA|nr:DUF6262 family protein [Amycolatopsis coloradensis]